MYVLSITVNYIKLTKFKNCETIRKQLKPQY